MIIGRKGQKEAAGAGMYRARGRGGRGHLHMYGQGREGKGALQERRGAFTYVGAGQERGYRKVQLCRHFFFIL